MTSSGADAVRSAPKGAREAVKNAGGRVRVRLPRILPVPSKIGGVSHLIAPRVFLIPEREKLFFFTPLLENDKK